MRCLAFFFSVVLEAPRRKSSILLTASESFLPFQGKVDDKDRVVALRVRNSTAIRGVELR